MRRVVEQVDPDTGHIVRLVEVVSVTSKSVATVVALNGPMRGTLYPVACSQLRDGRQLSFDVEEDGPDAA